MARREEVIAAYRLVLGREPESDAVVDHYCGLPDLEQLELVDTFGNHYSSVLSPSAAPLNYFSSCR